MTLAERLIQKGFEKGALEVAQEIACRLRDMGWTPERIQEATALLSLPVCRRTAACSPQTDFPGVHTRPHPVSVVQGRDVPATKLFAAGVKNFCVCPRTTAP